MDDGERNRRAIVEGYQSGSLIAAIDAALREAGKDPAHLAPEDLKPVDEFHTGGIAATEHLLERAAFPRGARIADLGSGLGGPARLMALALDARVEGVDLTPEFVAVAEELSRRVGLDERTRFHVGSVTDLPLADAAFDHATMIHVGMNVADKARLMAQAARVLRPGGRFATFEIMQGEDETPLAFPLPWARSPAASHLATPGEYRAAAEAAGFGLIEEEDRTDFALAFFDKIFAMVAENGLPPLGAHLVMGADAREKMTNYVANAKAGRMQAVQMIFEKKS